MSADSSYQGITIAGVTVTVRDNDTAQVTGVSVTPGNARLVMNWTAVDNATGYTVQWKSGNQGYNTGNRQATVTSGTTTSHTITGLTNGTAYSVQVSATRTDANDGPPSAEVQDTPAVPTAAGVTVSKTALTVTEQDTTGGSYTVVLDSEPAATVTVTVAGHAGTDVTRTPGTLTFTTSDWETAQTVTVTAGDDADTTDDSVTLTHSAMSADSSYQGITIAGVTVTVRDNDTAQVTGVSVTPGNARLVMNWTAVDNATGYTVQWKSGNQGYNTGNRQATVTSGTTTSHTITGLTNGTAYSVQVTATRTDANDGPPSAEVQDTPAVPTAAGVTVSKTALTVTEQDTTGGSYTVVLDSEPAATVTVTVAGHAGTDVTRTPGTLTFTTSDWETAQTVTVTAGDDADTTDDSVTLTHSAMSADSSYQGITIAGVTVTVRDNDTAQVTGVSVTPGNARLVMNWTAVDNATGYTVQWKSGNQGYNTGNRQATVTSGTTTSHTITGLTNGTAYSVQVTATRTDANDGPPSAEVQDTPAVPTAAGVTVSKTALTVTEQDTTGGSYTVVLDSEPAATVTVTVAGHAGTDVTRTPGTLTFTTSNWDTVQTVTVTAGDDADTTDDSVTLTHSAASTDTGYNGITIAGVVVTVRDNDTAQVTGVSVDAGDARLVVNWTAVDNATGYTVQWKSGSQNYNTGNRQATVTSGTTTSHTITGLTTGTAYTVQVSAARTGANDGPPSAGVTKTPEANTSTNTDPLTLTVEAVQDTVTEGEPVRYRIVMSKPTPGVEVEAVYRYRGEFLRHDPVSTITGIRSRGSVLYWEIERDTLDDVVVEANGRFTVRLQPGEGYTLGEPSSVTVRILDNDEAESPEPPVSPPLISVANARVREGPGAVLAFTVTLDRASRETATVDWETLNGRAKAGQDYVAGSGTLVFAPGETVKTVNVAVLDDVHNEGKEAMALYLWNPVGAIIADAVASGTIENSDPLPRALMGRFGRTAAVHVVERVEARMAAAREVGFEAQFAGRQVRPGMAREMALDFLRPIGASAGMHAPGSGGALSGAPMAATVMAAGPMGGMAGPDGGLFDRGLPSMGLGGGNLLTGSSFAFNRKTRQGGLLSFWSRGAQASFAGRERTLGLDGDVRTTMIGADYATGPMVVGLSLAHSRGRGGYHGLSSMSSGHVASSVTGLYPWLGYKATDRISLWGVTGYGKGALTLTPGAGAALQSGLSMAMAAGGLRGELADSVVAGFGLAFKADALWVGTAIDGVEGPGGTLAATAAAVTRVRTGLEASRGYRFQRGLSLQPSLEVGLRRDGGDAETGAGVDIGGGLIVSDRLTGLSADVRVRMLLAHQDEGFRERGLSVSFSFDPTPLGFLAKVTPSWGGRATSGAQALWGQETMAGMSQGVGASGNRLEAELGYGMPVWGRLVGMPRFGIGASDDGRDYRLGYGLTVAEGGAMSFELGVDAHRRESLGQQGAEHGVQGRLTARW